MPALQVRDFPEELYQQLKNYAAVNHRSMAQQTIIAVDQMINHAGHISQEHKDRISSAHAQGLSRYGSIVHFETEEERAARIARKRAVFDRIDEHYKTHPHPNITLDEITETIHEMREERTNRILEAACIHIPEGGAAQ